MAVVKELIREESNGAISFGNYELTEKTKKSDVEISGDSYKVKTFNEITKLERNGMFVYESIPGTAVNVFAQKDDKVSFFIDGNGDTQITLELESNQEYSIIVGDKDLGVSKTDVGGKITFDAELTKGALTQVVIEKK